MGPPRENLVLFGFMGAGKTAVARVLSRLFHMEWVDTDAVVEERAGSSPAEILRGPGEARLRELERQVVRDLARREHTVIATGGGVALDPDNLRTLGARGVLILLRATPRTLSRRLGLDPGDRPLLAGADEASIAAKLAEREAAYGSIPHRVDTDGRQVEDVAREVYGLYIRHCRGRF